ncbi:GntR family transcriptional regulator [Propionibacteriaceae bacterium Y2011]
MTVPAPTPRTTIAEDLRRRIIDGEFAPGSRLSEAAMTAHLDVSRNTVREAFRLLQAQGLVEHVAHRGVSVVSPTVADVVDIYRARRALECHVLGHAAPRHPRVAAMQAAIEQGEAAAAADDWRVVGTANMAFHESLVALSDSPRLMRSFGNVLAELRLAFLEIDDSEGLHHPFVGRNRALLDTLVEQGPAAAATALERYLVDSERVVLAALTRRP